MDFRATLSVLTRFHIWVHGPFLGSRAEPTLPAVGRPYVRLT